MPGHLEKLRIFTCDFQNHEIPAMNSSSFLGMLANCGIPSPRELDIEIKYGNKALIESHINSVLEMLAESKTTVFQYDAYYNGKIADGCEATLTLILGFLYRKLLEFS
jgi:hypothetical protein